MNESELYYIVKETSPGVKEVVAIGYYPEWVEHGGIKFTNEPFNLGNFQGFKKEAGNWQTKVIPLADKPKCSCHRTDHVLDDYCLGLKVKP